MRLLTLQEMGHIHDRVVQTSGGALGIREPGLLAAIAEKAEATFDGQDLYPTLFDKAAAVFEALCNYHVFVDGNKRTALVSLEYLLHLNGYQLTAGAEVREKFVLDTATSHPDLADVAVWVKKYAKAVK